MITKEIKILVFNACVKIAAQKINTFKNALQEAQGAANNETKSSAGDKHETGRAMAQLETEKLTAQLAEATKLEETLSKINTSIKHNVVRLGSLVKTNHTSFFIAASLGKVVIDKIDYYVISSISPVGKQLIGLKPAATFSFNNRNYLIEDVV